MGAGVGDENAESCGAVRPLRIPLVLRPLRRALETVWLQCDEAQQVGCLRVLVGCPLV